MEKSKYGMNSFEKVYYIPIHIVYLYTKQKKYLVSPLRKIKILNALCIYYIYDWIE